MIPQLEYMELVARKNLDHFLKQGYATAGHNGPHGHTDTPVRNTAHYLIIYSYLYRQYNEQAFADVCATFYEYLKMKQGESKSGAIQCMVSEQFDHLNGLIGQAWVIEALIYYYETFHVDEAVAIAEKIFRAQKYNWDKHLWHRIELDGTDKGIDVTSNHNVWFAGCSYKLAEYCNAIDIDAIIKDFLENGQHVILNTYKSGLIVHPVVCDDPLLKQGQWKEIVRALLSPFKAFYPRKLDKHYMDYGYHIYDLYGYSILLNQYGGMSIFGSDNFKKALSFGSNTEILLRLNNVSNPAKTNVYFYPYNSPAFEWPFVAKVNGFISEEDLRLLWANQLKIMYDENTGEMTRNNPDIETWNARTYEIIRFVEAQ